MKRIFLLVAIVGLLSGDARARTWKSSDGTKTFEGTLRSYDKNTGTVKVINARGQLLTFNQSVLSGEDREFLLAESLKSSGPADPTAELEKTKVGKQVAGAKLKLVDGKRFKSAKLDKAPEYYILYFSASW